MKRQRITITLRDDLVRDVDAFIDSERIRTRSHAIEYLLMQSLKPGVRTALILAAGKGVRMKPLTEELPKSLLPVGGRPILEYQIDLLREAGVREIVMLIGHLGEKIKYHFGDGSKFGVRIVYVEQKQALIGTAYALHLAKNLLGEKSFVVLYGDVLAEISLSDFIHQHIASGSSATIALTSLKEPGEYGMTRLRGQKIVEFVEKPGGRDEFSYVVNAGIFCFSPTIFGSLPGNKNASLEKEVFPRLAREEQLNGYIFEGKWFDIGTQEIYQRAIREWKR